MVEENTTAILGLEAPRAESHVGASDAWGELERLPFFTELKTRTSEGRQFVAGAPGRLSVMGGVSEAYGSLTVQTPIGEPSFVSISNRSDGTFTVVDGGTISKNGRATFVVPVASLNGKNGGVVEASLGRMSLVATQPLHVRCAVGALAEFLRVGNVHELNGGLSIHVSSSDSIHQDVSCLGALASATVVALAKATETSLDERTAQLICGRVLADWVGIAASASDLSCILTGEDGLVTLRQGDPSELISSFRMPKDLALVGVDSGVVPGDLGERLERVRAASLIGCFLVGQIRQHEGSVEDSRHGVLSQVSITDYVEKYRDRLPTKIKGSEFLSRVKEKCAFSGLIAPSQVYKVRSRTEHHVYEHARARQFAECLGRAGRTNDELPIIDAGELMYASHWSYGQRCGLGSVETDLLVNLIRRAGIASDIFGAKITGFGCGGVLAVLMRHTQRAQDALRDALKDYELKTKLQPRVLANGHHGAMRAGVRVM